MDLNCISNGNHEDIDSEDDYQEAPVYLDYEKDVSNLANNVLEDLPSRGILFDINFIVM